MSFENAQEYSRLEIAAVLCWLKEKRGLAREKLDQASAARRPLSSPYNEEEVKLINEFHLRRGQLEAYTNVYAAIESKVFS